MRGVVPLLLLLLLPLVAQAHAHHATWAEADLRAERGVLEVALRMDPADLEAELALRIDEPPLLEAAAADTSIAELLVDHFVVTDTAGRVRPLHWVGKEVGAREVWLYFEIAVGEGLDGLRMCQSLGMALHERQINTVKLRGAGAQWTLAFTRETPELSMLPTPASP